MAKRGNIGRLYDAVIDAGKSAMRILRAPTGESGMARLIGPFGAGGYGSGPLQLSAGEQVQHFRGWSYKCVDYIASTVASMPPTAVRAADPAAKAEQDAKMKVWRGAVAAMPARTKAAYLGSLAPNVAASLFTPPFPVRPFATPHWRFKAVGPAQANEEYEFLDNTHPLVRLLNDPNDPETGVNLWYEAEMFNCLTGVDYIWKVHDDAGRVESLWVIPSHWVTPICRGDTELVDYFEVSARGTGSGAGVVKFEPEEIIWNKRPSPLSKLYPASPLQAMASTVDAYEKTEAARNFGMDTGVGVSGVLTAPPESNLTDAMIQRLESRFAARYAGVFNFGRPMILEGGLQWTPAPADREIAYLSSADQLKDYVIALWGLDKTVLGFGDTAAWAGAVANIRNVDYATISPRKRVRAAVLTEGLAKEFGEDVRIFYPPNIPLDPDARRQDFTAAGAANAVSANDWRTHVLELEPWPEEIYDRPLVSPGLVNPGDDGGAAWDQDGAGGGGGFGGGFGGEGGGEFGADAGGFGGGLSDSLDTSSDASSDASPDDSQFGDDHPTNDFAAGVKMLTSWLGKIGAPPRPGLVLNEQTHRWERPGGGSGGAGGSGASGPNGGGKPSSSTSSPASLDTGSVSDSPEVHASRCRRLAASISQFGQKAVDAAVTVGAKAYLLGMNAQWAVMKAGINPDDIADTANDYAKIINAKGVGDFLSTHLGVSGNTAAVVSSHVLAYAVAKLKQAVANRRAGGAAGRAAGKGIGDNTPNDTPDMADAVAELLRTVYGGMGVPDDMLPTAEDVREWMEHRDAWAAGGDAGGSPPNPTKVVKHGKPPFPGAVFNEQSHRWEKPTQGVGGGRDKPGGDTAAPRDRSGRKLDLDFLEEARTDRQLADEMRREVHPDDRPALERLLAGGGAGDKPSGVDNKPADASKPSNDASPAADRGQGNPNIGDHSRPDLSAPEVDAIKQYTEWDYDTLNRSLRTRGAPPEKLEATNAALQSAFAKAKPFGPPPVVANRYMDLDRDAVGPFIEAVKQAHATGSPFTTGGYISTTVDDDYKPEKNANIQLSINAVHGLDLMPYSAYADQERELLLNHGSRFRVAKVEQVGKQWHIVMDQIPPVAAAGVEAARKYVVA